MKNKVMKFNNFTYMLAPLEDYTDNAFRTLCYKYGADLTFTEMIRVEGLARANASTFSRLDFHDDTPTVVQLIGSKEDRLKKFLSGFRADECITGFNLNIGCPSPQMIKIGQGCAMIKRIAKTDKLVKILQKAGYSMSLKLRLGLNSLEKERKVYLNLIKKIDADFFVVHCRHGGQTYAEPADYGVLQECTETGKTIIANGDIDTKEKVKTVRDAGVKGVMIGRAAVKNPGIFAALKDVEVPRTDIILREYKELCERFKAPYKYQKNVLKHIGTDEDLIER